MAVRHLFPVLVLVLLMGLGSACSSPKTSGSGTISSTTITSTIGTSTSTSSPGPSPPLAAGSPVPGYRVGPLSFLSSSQGYGLYEFDATGQSNAQQLVASRDGGITWQVETSTALPAWASNVDFPDTDTGYAWGSQGLDVTHDGGEQWSNTLAISGGPEAVSPIGANIWAIMSSGRLEASPDGGTTWLRTPVPVPVENPVIISRVSPSVGFVFGCGSPGSAGTAAGFLARTEDAGRSWQVMSPPVCQFSSASIDLVALSADDLWLVEFGQPSTNFSSKWVYRSYDGGESWTLVAEENLANPSQDQGHISPIGDLGPLSVLGSDPNTAWLAEDRGGLLVTTDGGLDWQPAFNDAGEADAFGPPMVSFLDPDNGWAATGYGLWRTTDGTVWTDIASAPGVP